MTEQPDTPEPKRRDQLTEEASAWFAKMRGPDAPVHRPAFDTWLARGALHRSAYNRVGEIFAMGRFLAEEKASDARMRDVRRSRRALIAIAATLLVGIMASGAWVMFALQKSGNGNGDHIDLVQAARPGPLQLATLLGEIRTVRLEDGSLVTLDSDSLLIAMFDRSHRSLRLERGRVRFSVAHEQRPFTVTAGSGTVTAHGTKFDISIDRSRAVTVTLIEGAVDVSKTGIERATVTTTKRLKPGEMVSYSPATPIVPITRLAGDAGVAITDWTSAMMSYDQAPLATVIADANARSPVPIRLSSPLLGERRVSGTFRVNDTDKIADRLASLFDLTVDRSNPAEIVLHQR